MVQISGGGGGRPAPVNRGKAAFPHGPKGLPPRGDSAPAARPPLRGRRRDPDAERPPPTPSAMFRKLPAITPGTRMR